MITATSSFRAMVDVFKSIPELDIDPCGSLYMCVTDEIEIYGTPNWVEEGEIPFELYVDEEHERTLFTATFKTLNKKELRALFKKAKDMVLLDSKITDIVI